MTFRLRKSTGGSTLRGGDTLGAGTAVAITAREFGFLYRNPDMPRLILMGGHSRSMAYGLKSAEGWERVSGLFAWNDNDRGPVDIAVSAAWQANKSAAIATLKAAINSALQANGFRAPNGDSLT